MTTDLNEKELALIGKWLDGDYPDIYETDILERFAHLSEAVRRKTVTDMKGTRRKCIRLEQQAEKRRLEERTAAEAGDYGCLGFSSVEIANAALYCSRMRSMPITNPDLLQLNVFAIYATWLGEKSQRVTIEHPAAIKRGPVFFPLMNDKKFSVYGDDNGTAYRNVAAVEPGLAKLIQNVTLHYSQFTLAEIKAFFTQRHSPWHTRACAVEKGIDKWGKTEIPDKEIWLWKQDHHLTRGH